MQLFIACILVPLAVVADPHVDPKVGVFAKRIDGVRMAYDIPGAATLLEEMSKYVEAKPTREGDLEVGRAALAVAELLRYQYEWGGLGPIDRRNVGKKIDSAAYTGHRALNRADPSSEKYRIKADLWGTMIRSDFKAKKYGTRMERAAEIALDLDPENPNAYVTGCKRALYAPEKRGGDLDLAMEYLDTALKLAPHHEAALIMRGIGWEKMDEFDKAMEAWNKALDLNPNCRPAKENLARLEKKRKSALRPGRVSPNLRGQR